MTNRRLKTGLTVKCVPQWTNKKNIYVWDSG